MARMGGHCIRPEVLGVRNTDILPPWTRDPSAPAVRVIDLGEEESAVELTEIDLRDDAPGVTSVPNALNARPPPLRPSTRRLQTGARPLPLQRARVVDTTAPPRSAAQRTFCQGCDVLLTFLSMSLIVTLLAIPLIRGALPQQTVLADNLVDILKLDRGTLGTRRRLDSGQDDLYACFNDMQNAWEEPSAAQSSAANSLVANNFDLTQLSVDEFNLMSANTQWIVAMGYGRLSYSLVTNPLNVPAWMSMSCITWAQYNASNEKAPFEPVFAPLVEAMTNSVQTSLTQIFLAALNADEVASVFDEDEHFALGYAAGYSPDRNQAILDTRQSATSTDDIQHRDVYPSTTANAQPQVTAEQTIESVRNYYATLRATYILEAHRMDQLEDNASLPRLDWAELKGSPCEDSVGHCMTASGVQISVEANNARNGETPASILSAAKANSPYNPFGCNKVALMAASIPTLPVTWASSTACAQCAATSCTGNATY